MASMAGRVPRNSLKPTGVWRLAGRVAWAKLCFARAGASQTRQTRASCRLLMPPVEQPAMKHGLWTDRRCHTTGAAGGVPAAPLQGLLHQPNPVLRPHEEVGGELVVFQDAVQDLLRAVG